MPETPTYTPPEEEPTPSATGAESEEVKTSPKPRYQEVLKKFKEIDMDNIGDFGVFDLSQEEMIAIWKGREEAAGSDEELLETDDEISKFGDLNAQEKKTKLSQLHDKLKSELDESRKNYASAIGEAGHNVSLDPWSKANTELQAYQQARLALIHFESRLIVAGILKQTANLTELSTLGTDDRGKSAGERQAVADSISAIMVDRIVKERQELERQEIFARASAETKRGWITKTALQARELWFKTSKTRLKIGLACLGASVVAGVVDYYSGTTDSSSLVSTIQQSTHFFCLVQLAEQEECLLLRNFGPRWIASALKASRKLKNLIG